MQTTAVAVFFFALLTLCHGHMFVLGSRGGVTPNDVDVPFFSTNGIAPCGGIPDSASQFLNVTKNDVFTLSWALIVNHNSPPAVPGTISFGYAQELSLSSVVEIVTPSVTVGNLPTNHFNAVSFPVPPVSGPVTIQIVYDVNGASSPSPAYYQCVDLYVS